MVVLPMILSMVCGVVLMEGFPVSDANSNFNTNANVNRRNRNANASNRRNRKLPRDWLPIDQENDAGSQKFFEQINDGYYEDYLPRIKMLSSRAANAALSITRTRAEEMAESVAYAIGDAVARILAGYYENSILDSRRSTNYNTNLNTNIIGRTSPKKFDQQESAQGEGDLGGSATIDMADLESILGIREENSASNAAAKTGANGWKNLAENAEKTPYGLLSDLIQAAGNRPRGDSQSYRNEDEIEAAVNQPLYDTVEVADSAENDGVTDLTQATENLEGNGGETNTNENTNANRRNSNVNYNVNSNVSSNRKKHSSRYRRE